MKKSIMWAKWAVCALLVWCMVLGSLFSYVGASESTSDRSNLTTEVGISVQSDPIKEVSFSEDQTVQSVDVQGLQETLLQPRALTLFHETWPTIGDPTEGQDEQWYVVTLSEPGDLGVNTLAIGSPPGGASPELSMEDCDDAWGLGDIIWAALDLSAYKNVTISYWWQQDNTDFGEGFRSAYSIDATGGTDAEGTWTLMYEWLNPSENIWFQDTYIIPDIDCVSNFKFRFNARAGGSGEESFFDEVVITGDIADDVPPAQVQPLVGTAGDSQVTLNWTGYDEAGQGDVVEYHIYKDTSPISSVSSMTHIATVPAGTFQCTALDLRNGIDYYFAVTAIDEVPNEDTDVIDAGPLTPLPYRIVSIPLSDGWNLISIPVILEDPTVASVFSAIPWDYVQYYNASDNADHWKTNSIYKPPVLNDLLEIDHMMALWLHVTGVCTLDVGGSVPQSVDITMVNGWNFVGYPSFSTTTTVADALAGVPYDRVEGYSNTAPYRIEVIGNDYVMQKGEGYWVRCTGASTWSMANDVLAPIVSDTFPTDGSTGVSVDTAIDITFSEEIDKASAETAFAIDPPAAGTFSWNGIGTIMTFTPSSPLSGGPTTYTVTIAKTALDISGNGLAWIAQSVFTTADSTPPEVVSTDPFDGELDVSTGSDIIITFSEEMNQALTEAAFSIVPAVAGSFSWNGPGTVMTFNPSSSLAIDTIYTVTISTGAQNLGGTPMASPYVFDFSTINDPVEKHAIIVGISNYLFISDLSYCDEDATDWYYYLDGLGYTCEIYGDATSPYPFLTGFADEAVVRAAIQNKEATLTANDYLVFTTSGHGNGNGVGSSYLCMRDCNGAAGCYYDTELQVDMDDCAAYRMFVFIDHCFAGGMGPELMSMPNSLKVYCTTTCTENGYGYDVPAYLNGAWTYWYLEWGWVNGNGATDAEGNFAAADSQYNPGGGDEPMEFDGDAGNLFYL